MTRARTLALVLGTAAVGAGALFLPDGEKDDSRRRGVYAFDLYEEADRVHLLLVDYGSGDESPELHYVRSEDGGRSFSKATRVDRGTTPAFVPYRGVDPQIAAAGDAVVAVWTTAGDDLYGYGTGPLATALSEDGGRTWTAGPNPADDGLTTAHEFLDVAADAKGVFHLVWIDDRDDAEGIRRGLRYARSSDGGSSWSANVTLDEHMCGCCWTHLRVDATGRLYVLYRDEDPAPSDMKLLVSEDGGEAFGELGSVGAFDWRERGCPHTTAGLAFRFSGEGEEIHAVVQTGKEGLAGIYHLASRDRAESWSEPSRVADEGGHFSDLAASGELLAAVWQGQIGTRTVIYGRFSSDGAANWSEPELLSDPGTSSAHPRISRDGDAFRVYWIESKVASRHRFQSVPFVPRQP